jgi:GTP-binding protein
MFIDEVTLELEAGDGGRGAVAWRREKFIPKGGPAGGDGGRGGSVLLEATSRENTLLRYRHKHQFAAQRGGHGSGNRRSGKDGEDLILPVPLGTQVWDVDSTLVLADLVRDGDRWEAVRGGRGGKGNAHFATSVRQAPQFAQPGEPGEQLKVKLILKLLADIGLVGFPNAGKSTLISAISAARPEVADYPFTTLVPHLGVVDAGEFRSFVVADLPGLIEGAHEGRGLGDRFLRHIERCRALALVVDVSSVNPRDPLQDLECLEDELAKYSAELAQRQRLIVASKIDALDDPDRLERLQSAAHQRSTPFLAISSATRQFLSDLIRLMDRFVRSDPRQESA